MLEQGQKIKLGKVRPLVLEPDLRLHKKSETVSSIDDNVRSIIDDMIATMIHDDGVGLAAVQVGVMQRILVIDCAHLINKDDRTKQILPPSTTVFRMINPEITEAHGKDIQQEGCLSVPGVHPDVTRSESIKVKYIDYWGAEQEIALYGWVARCFQHELDHLNGITLLDKLSPLKKSLAIKRIQKAQKRLS